MDDNKKKDGGSEQPETGGRLGKEAKIGLAVIGLLAVGLCAAVAWRLGGSSDADPHDGAKTAAASNPSEGESGRKHSVARTPAEPTVVAAKASVGEAPDDAAMPAAQWDSAGEALAAEVSRKPEPLEPPLNYMPVPPEPEPVEVRDPYAEQAPQMAEPGPSTWQGLPPQTGGPYSPVQDAEPPAAATVDQPPREQAPPELRVIEPPSVQRSEPEPGYASAGSPPDQFLPPESEPVPRSVRAAPVARSRFDDGVAPLGGEDLLDEQGRYTVQPNDSYWAICERLYGSGAYFKALIEHNRQRNVESHQLAVGDTVLAPPREELEEIYPGLCPKPEHREVQKNHLAAVSSQRPYGGGRTYVVQENDSLFDIARWELGKASRWVEIYQLNRDLIGSDYNYLPVGTELVLPESPATDRLTEQPGGATSLR